LSFVVVVRTHAMGNVVYAIAAILVFLWLLAAVAHIGVDIGNLLLIVAVILILFNIVVGRRGAG
jgi:uncharacterized membrane protein